MGQKRSNTIKKEVKNNQKLPKTVQNGFKHSKTVNTVKTVKAVIFFCQKRSKTVKTVKNGQQIQYGQKWSIQSKTVKRSKQ